MHRIFLFLVKNIIKKDLMLVQPNIKACQLLWAIKRFHLACKKRLKSKFFPPLLRQGRAFWFYVILKFGWYFTLLKQPLHFSLFYKTLENLIHFLYRHLVRCSQSPSHHADKALNLDLER